MAVNCFDAILAGIPMVNEPWLLKAIPLILFIGSCLLVLMIGIALYFLIHGLIYEAGDTPSKPVVPKTGLPEKQQRPMILKWLGLGSD